MVSRFTSRPTSLAYFCTGLKMTFSATTSSARFRTQPMGPRRGEMPRPKGAVFRLDRLSGVMPQVITAGRFARGVLRRRAAPMKRGSQRTASAGVATMADWTASY